MKIAVACMMDLIEMGTWPHKSGKALFVRRGHGRLRATLSPGMGLAIAIEQPVGVDGGVDLGGG